MPRCAQVLVISGGEGSWRHELQQRGGELVSSHSSCRAGTENAYNRRGQWESCGPVIDPYMSWISKATYAKLRENARTVGIGCTGLLTWHDGEQQLHFPQ